MNEITKIDEAGRLVIPIRLRRRHHLVAVSRLRIREEGPRILLEPIPLETETLEENGLLVIKGTIQRRHVDHRTVREERLDRLTPDS